MAKACGYTSGHSFEALEKFSENVEAILNEPGPTFVAMKIVPEIENEPIGRRTRVPSRSKGDIIKDLREDLKIG